MALVVSHPGGSAIGAAAGAAADDNSAIGAIGAAAADDNSTIGAAASAGAADDNNSTITFC